MTEYVLRPDAHLEWMRENFDAALGTQPDQLGTALEDSPGWQVDTVIDHFARGTPVRPSGEKHLAFFCRALYGS